MVFVVTNSCASCGQVLGVTSRELIPRGTRFGPVVGECYSNETLLKDVNRKYFWRVSDFYVSFCIFCEVACIIHLCVCALQDHLHPVSPTGGVHRGCGVARVSSCGRHLTSCESMTLHANA